MFKRILAVDDSELILNMHETAFSTLPDVELLKAHDGLEALKVVREQEDINLILLDLNMPLMDGITFLEKLRTERGEIAKIPVIVISSEGEEQNIMKALKKGADAYIKKPFKKSELLNLLNALEQRVHAQ